LPGAQAAGLGAPECYNPRAMQLLQEVADFIRQERLLEPSQLVILGVSGGADSLCLLDVLHRLGYPLVVAHFDHGLRPESGQEALRVQEMAAFRGLDFEVERGALTKESYLDGSLEAAARHARYRFLLRVATEKAAQRIATGHTADDQIETLLMNLLRGAGPDGLRGMKPLTPIGRWPEFGPGVQSDVQLARPLLGLGRNRTRDYCARHGLSPVSDASNQDRRFLRNRVRHDLLESLEYYNPEVRQALLRTSRIMGDVADLLETLVDQAWENCVRSAGAGALAFNAAVFTKAPLAIQRRMLRRAVAQLGVPTREAGFEAVERVRTAMLGEGPSQLNLPGRVAVERVGSEWLLARPDARVTFPDYPQLDAPTAVRVPDSGSVELAHGWRLRVGYQAMEDGAQDHVSDETTVVFDADQIPHPIIVRSSVSGEKLAPFGMHGRVKLSDVFIDHKVPRRLRARWPVVSSGDDILWVPGLRRGSLAPVGASTQRIVELRLVPPRAEG